MVWSLPPFFSKIKIVDFLPMYSHSYQNLADDDVVIDILYDRDLSMSGMAVTGVQREEEGAEQTTLGALVLSTRVEEV